jgi:hypothetical protein
MTVVNPVARLRPLTLTLSQREREYPVAIAPGADLSDCVE